MGQCLQTIHVGTWSVVPETIPERKSTKWSNSILITALSLVPKGGLSLHHDAPNSGANLQAESQAFLGPLMAPNGQPRHQQSTRHSVSRIFPSTKRPSRHRKKNSKTGAQGSKIPKHPDTLLRSLVSHRVEGHRLIESIRSVFRSAKASQA